MRITIDIELNDTEKKLLARILKTEDDDSLAQRFGAITSAAAEEYKVMILGQKVFTRGRDIQEFRLFSLIKFYFDGRIPNEQEVCALFQCRPSEAKTLINSIRAKYQYQLEQAIGKSLKAIIDKAKRDDKTKQYKFTLSSAVLKEEINRILLNVDPQLPQLERVGTSGGEYALQASAHTALIDALEEMTK